MTHSRLYAFRAITALLVLLPAALGAQVGTPPSLSPYHDILHGNGWTLMAGRVGGSGAALRQSPNSGMNYGIRYDIRFSGLLQGFAELGYLATQRQLLNRDDSVATRFGGKIDQGVWTPEIGLQVNLTGPKTWHGIAPFVAIGMGAAVGKKTPQDTSGFTFGTKLLLTPGTGVRFYIAQRVHVRIEGMFYYWKMKYPSTWLLEPSKQPSTVGQPTTAPIKSTNGLTDWVPTPALRLGIGFAF